MQVVAEVLNRRKEIPLASLIDVVVLLLIYFMATSSLIKKEADLPFSLPMPGGILPDVPIEILVDIHESGLVTIEGERFAGQEDLFRRLEVLKAVAEASRSELIVSVWPSDRTLHGDIIPVMDACAAAGIVNLSFNTAW